GFRGQFKAPQTLGEWKTTRHVIEFKEGAAALDLRVVFRGGGMRLRLDNFRIEDAGLSEPTFEIPPVYAAALAGGVALLELDLLTPTLTYELTVTTATADHRGLGVRCSTVNGRGEATQPLELPGVVERGPDLVYRFTVPADAVRTRLDLYSDDLQRHGPYYNRKYRQFQRVVIRLVNTRPAEDTMMYNFEQGMADGGVAPRPREVTTVSELDRREIDHYLASRPPQEVEIKRINGGLALVVGGRPQPPIIAAGYTAGGRFDSISQLGKRGVNVVRMDNLAGGPALNGTWLGPGEYDFGPLDEAVYRYLKQNRNAQLMVWLGGLYPPLWWGDQHPDEILRNQDNLGCSLYNDYGEDCMWGPLENGQLGQAHARKWAGSRWLLNKGAKAHVTYVPSPASLLYRQAMKEYLTALRRHVERQPYASAVIGYFPHWGYDGQWNWLGQVKNQDINNRPLGPQQVDYSRPMQAWFRAFLKQRYGSDAALQAAWGQAAVTLATAAIPTPAERFASMAGPKPWSYLLDPARQRNVMDFNEASAQVVGDLLTDMAQAIKAAAPRKVLVGTYFQHIDRDFGHDQLLRQPGLDLSGGPEYDAREVGQPGISPHTHDSFRLHGKLELTEVDHRIFPVLWRTYASNQLFETPRKTISILQREFGRQICRGQGAWLLDMGFGWYNEPIPADTMGQIHEVFAQTLTLDRASPARMAMFIGPDSYYAEHFRTDFNRKYWLGKQVRATMALAGVPIDLYSVNDLPAVADRYKVFIFPLAWSLTDAQVASIEQLKRDGNLLVFGPAAGYVGSSSRGAERVAALTGMALKQDDRLPFTVQVTDTDHAITRDLQGFIGVDEGNHATLDYPMLEVVDPAAVALAHYAGQEGRVGLAYKNCGTWQSVYCGMVAPLPAELLRGLARQAGLHLYSTGGDPMYFANQVLAIHAASDGLKTITLPQEYLVTSLWDQREFGRMKVIRREMRTGDNALYRLLPAAP
ncbi:MAG: hypothetical protein HUU35_05420, partial [Armatimonadetes bacterium]|nr:hypothetical protein [Armatimonadota bacterium]